jgi:hypothetical protein
MGSSSPMRSNRFGRSDGTTVLGILVESLEPKCGPNIAFGGYVKMKKVTLIMSLLLAVASIVAWARSYRITDFYCLTDRHARTWVVSTSSGVVSVSRPTRTNHRLVGLTPLRQGHVAVVEWKGLNRDWPAALLLFRWMDSGPVDRLADRKGIHRSSILGFGSQTGVIADAMMVYVQCDEISIPLWPVSFLALVFPGSREL